MTAVAGRKAADIQEGNTGKLGDAGVRVLSFCFKNVAMLPVVSTRQVIRTF